MGVIRLQDARAEAKRRLAECTLGKDKPRAISWDDAKEEFLAEKKNELKPRTLADYTYQLGKHFRYGPTKLSELTPNGLWKNIEQLRKTPAE